MKIWIDVLTPKQVLFFQGIAEELKKLNHEVFFTTRRFRETIRLAEKYLYPNFTVKCIGEYGGKKLVNKLIASLERARKLTDYIYLEKPDIALSFTSPEASRVAFGLDIPHISVSDIPQSWAASKLSIPFSRKLYSPWIIPKARWIRYGIEEDKIFQYKGLDPVVWLRRHRVDNETVANLGLREMNYIVIRTVEEKVSYQLNILSKLDINIKSWVINFLRLSRWDYKIFILPRYEDQIEKLKKLFHDESDHVIIIDKVIDGPTLLKYADAFVGYGGTMTVEASLLGIPTISIRPGSPPEYLKYLVNKRLIKHLNSEKKVVEEILKAIKNKNVIKDKALQLMNKMEDPAIYIAETIKEKL